MEHIGYYRHSDPNFFLAALDKNWEGKPRRVLHEVTSPLLDSKVTRTAWNDSCLRYCHCTCFGNQEDEDTSRKTRRASF